MEERLAGGVQYVATPAGIGWGAAGVSAPQLDQRLEPTPLIGRVAYLENEMREAKKVMASLTEQIELLRRNVGV